MLGPDVRISITCAPPRLIKPVLSHSIPLFVRCDSPSRPPSRFSLDRSSTSSGRERRAEGRRNLGRERDLRGHPVVSAVGVRKTCVVQDHAETRSADLEVVTAAARLDGGGVVAGSRPDGPDAPVSADLDASVRRLSARGSRCRRGSPRRAVSRPGDQRTSASRRHGNNSSRRSFRRAGRNRRSARSRQTLRGTCRRSPARPSSLHVAFGGTGWSVFGSTIGPANAGAARTSDAITGVTARASLRIRVPPGLRRALPLGIGPLRPNESSIHDPAPRSNLLNPARHAPWPRRCERIHATRDAAVVRRHTRAHCPLRLDRGIT